MQTMVQVYTAKTEERARMLYDDICKTFAGGWNIVVTSVEPFIDVDTKEVVEYGFRVYFDTVKIGPDIQVDIVYDRRNVVRDLHSLNQSRQRERDLEAEIDELREITNALLGYIYTGRTSANFR